MFNQYGRILHELIILESIPPAQSFAAENYPRHRLKTNNILNKDLAYADPGGAIKFQFMPKVVLGPRFGQVASVRPSCVCCEVSTAALAEP